MAVFSRSSSPSRHAKGTPSGRVNTHFGLYVGIVKDNKDAQLNGRLRVHIPEFGGLEHEESGWITVCYCSPFAGITPHSNRDKNNTTTYNGSQTTYGMWMIPPDVENRVAVMFQNGDQALGFWFGCIFDEFQNFMVPAIASSGDNHRFNNDPTYKNAVVPVVEYNKYTTDSVGWKKATRPIHEPYFNSISAQGLINDNIRGVTSSSARRESPSMVYGISTPGPRNPNSAGNRLGGSKFVMDDGEGSEYIGLKTRSGASLRLDETNGIVYVINKKGTAWLQLDDDGNVDIFSAKSISLRAMEDINLRADRDLVFEAGNDIKIKASKDYTGTGVVSVPGGGQGGNIIVEALNKLDVTITSQAKFNFKDTLDIIVNKDARLEVVEKLDINTKFTTHTSSEDTKFLAKSNFMMTSNKDFDILSNNTLKMASDNDMHLFTLKNMMQLSMMNFNVTGGIAINNQSIAISLLGGTSIRGTAPSISWNGAPASPAIPAQPASPAPPAVKPLKAALIPMNPKTNILSDFMDKFTRNSHKMNTILGRFMTYEPCPDHVNKGKNTSFSKYDWSNGQYDVKGPAGGLKPVPYKEGTPPPSVNDDEVAIPIAMEDFKCGKWTTPERIQFGKGSNAVVVNPKELYDAKFKEAGEAYGVPPQILSRVAFQESSFNPNAYNRSGATGLMQIVPRWHPSVKNPNDPNEAIPYSASYLSRLKRQFGTWDKALAAYNWGEGNLQKSINRHGDDWRNHLPAETANYVTDIGGDVGIFGCPEDQTASTGTTPPTT